MRPPQPGPTTPAQAHLTSGTRSGQPLNTVGSRETNDGSNPTSISRGDEPDSPSDDAIHANAAEGETSRSVTSPSRFANRRPDGPSTSGTCAYDNSAYPRARDNQICRGVESTRSAPRTTSSTPCNP